MVYWALKQWKLNISQFNTSLEGGVGQWGVHAYCIGVNEKRSRITEAMHDSI